MVKETIALENLLRELDNISVPEAKAKIQYKIAVEYYKLCDYSKTRSYAFAALENVLETDHFKDIALAYHVIGMSYFGIGENNLSKDYFLKAEEYYAKDNPEPNIDLLISLGSVDGHLGNFYTSFENFYKALDIAQRTGQKTKEMRILNNLSAVFRKIQNFPKALEYAKQNYHLHKEMTLQEMSDVFFNFANVYNLMDNLTLSKGYYKKALKIWEETKNHKLLSIAYNNYANLLFKIKKYDESIIYSLKAFKICAKINRKNGVITALINMGIIYNLKEHKNLARECFQISLDLAKDMDNEAMLETLYAEAASFFEQEKEFELSYIYYKKLFEIRNRIYTSEISNEIALLHSKQEFEKKRREAEIYKQKNEALDTFNQLIASQNKDLESLSNSKDIILNIVSHDLKNAIAGILTATEIIDKLNPTGEASIYLNIIKGYTKIAVDLVNDILEAHKLELQNFELELNENNLHGLFTEILPLLKQLSLTKNISIEYLPVEMNCYIQVNSDRFRQIMLNLVTNSVKFSERGKTIQVGFQKTIKYNKHYCRIFVRDFGIGIPEELRQNLFTKFTKASRRGTEGEESTGLGLSIVKKIADLHNAEITIDSTVNVGTIFYIDFPLSSRVGQTNE